jgi:hypothetical protein
MGARGTSSITKYGSPAALAPASSTRAMAACAITASACRSASKRASTSREAASARTTLSATRRRMGAVCSASYATPMPPSPSTRTMR